MSDICSQSCLFFRSCSHPTDWGIAVPKTSQTSDVDSDESCKSKLGQTKSELNTLIDEISAVSLGIDLVVRRVPLFHHMLLLLIFHVSSA